MAYVSPIDPSTTTGELVVLPIDPGRVWVYWVPLPENGVLTLRNAGNDLLARADVPAGAGNWFFDVHDDTPIQASLHDGRGTLRAASEPLPMPPTSPGDAPLRWLHVSDEFDVRDVPGPDRVPAVPLRPTRPFGPSSPTAARLRSPA